MYCFALCLYLYFYLRVKEICSLFLDLAKWKKKNVHKQCLMDLMEREQGEKSCIESYNNIIFIDKFLLFYKQYLWRINLLSGKGKADRKSRTATAQWEFHRSYVRRNKPRSGMCAEVSAVYRFCYKPNPFTVLKPCMILSRSLIMVLCFGRDLYQFIPSRKFT